MDKPFFLEKDTPDEGKLLDFDVIFKLLDFEPEFDFLLNLAVSPLPKLPDFSLWPLLMTWEPVGDFLEPTFCLGMSFFDSGFTLDPVNLRLDPEADVTLVLELDVAEPKFFLFVLKEPELTAANPFVRTADPDMEPDFLFCNLEVEVDPNPTPRLPLADPDFSNLEPELEPRVSFFLLLLNESVLLTNPPLETDPDLEPVCAFANPEVCSCFLFVKAIFFLEFAADFEPVLEVDNLEPELKPTFGLFLTLFPTPDF